MENIIDSPRPNWILPIPEVFLGFLRPVHESSPIDPRIYFIHLRSGGHRIIDCSTDPNSKVPLYYSEIPLRNIHYNYYLLYTELERFEEAKFVATALTFYNVAGVCGTMFQYIDPQGIEHTKGYSQENWTRDIIPKDLIRDLQDILLSVYAKQISTSNEQLLTISGVPNLSHNITTTAGDEQ